MKNLSRLLLVAVLVFAVSTSNAQDKNNPWAFGIGVNAVDPYPVGEDLPQGPYFDEFFNASDHWNIVPFPSSVSVSRYLSDGFIFSATGSVNTINRFGTRINAEGEEVANIIDDLTYFGLDGRVAYSFMELINSKTVEPTLGVGGGYTWLDDSGTGTLNGSLGLRYWLSEKVAIDASTMYKHVFDDGVVPKHWQHTLGLTFKFGGKDTDGDGIYDNEDACPEEAGLEIFNGCPDSDNDGIEDAKDDCPNEAGLAEFNGCPDTDGDGVPDKDDKCPTVAGLKTLMGCPDADGDGIADGDDNCPNEAGPAANNGCPWPDSDGDGVLDKDDECPNVAGTVANNGCPEVSEEVVKSLNTYARNILFETGKASFQKETDEVLQAMVTIFKEYPRAKFSIEGHTDSTGSAKNNQILSERRANAVRDYLVANGIAADRLTAQGFGEEKPIDTNNTRAGRANNRRVEVNLVKNN